MMYTMHRFRLVVGGGRVNYIYFIINRIYYLYPIIPTYVVKSKSSLIHGKHIPTQINS